MNIIGCHAQVWVGDVDGRSLRTAALKTRDAGFDLIEFPVLQPDRFDLDSAREALSETGLAASASLGLDDSCDISSDSPEAVAREPSCCTLQSTWPAAWGRSISAGSSTAPCGSTWRR